MEQKKEQRKNRERTEKEQRKTAPFLCVLVSTSIVNLGVRGWAGEVRQKVRDAEVPNLAGR